MNNRFIKEPVSLIPKKNTIDNKKPPPNQVPTFGQLGVQASDSIKDQVQCCYPSASEISDWKPKKVQSKTIIDVASDSESDEEKGFASKQLLEESNSRKDSKSYTSKHQDYSEEDDYDYSDDENDNASYKINIPSSVRVAANRVPEDELIKRKTERDKYLKSIGYSGPKERTLIANLDTLEMKNLMNQQDTSRISAVIDFQNTQRDQSVFGHTVDSNGKANYSNNNYLSLQSNAFNEVPDVVPKKDPDWSTFSEVDYVPDDPLKSVPKGKKWNPFKRGTSGKDQSIVWGPKIRQFACKGSTGEPKQISSLIISESKGPSWKGDIRQVPNVLKLVKDPRHQDEEIVLQGDNSTGVEESTHFPSARQTEDENPWEDEEVLVRANDSKYESIIGTVDETEDTNQDEIKHITIKNSSVGSSRRSKKIKKEEEDEHERMDCDTNNHLTVEDLNSLTVVRLRTMCREQGLFTSGNKSELILRLYNSFN